MRIVPIQTEVLVQIEADNAGEIEPCLPVQSNQLPVNADRRRSRGQPQYRRLTGRIVLPNQALDHQSDVAGGTGTTGEDKGRNPRMRHVMRGGRCHECSDEGPVAIGGSETVPLLDRSPAPARAKPCPGEDQLSTPLPNRIRYKLDAMHASGH